MEPVRGAPSEAPCWVYLSSLQGLDMKLGAKVKQELTVLTNFSHPPIPQTLETLVSKEGERDGAANRPTLQQLQQRAAWSFFWLLALFWQTRSLK